MPVLARGRLDFLAFLIFLAQFVKIKYTYILIL